MKRRLLAVLSVAAVCSQTYAETNQSQWYVSGQVGATITDSEWRLNNAPYFGLQAGKNLGNKWALELNALTGDHDGTRANADSKLNAYSLDALRFFSRDSRVSPYLSFGAGMLRNDIKSGPSKDYLLAQLGGGAVIRLWESGNASKAFNLRPEVKFRWNDRGNTHIWDTLIGLSFQYAFGGTAKTSQVVAVTPKPVAASAAPAPVAQPALLAPVVHEPVDTDGDGVIDTMDKCPDTAKGTGVDESGCAKLVSITLTGVNFENNSAKLKTESFDVLNPVAADIQKHSKLKIEIQGHTDSVGANAYNLKLSQARAESVKDYLVSKGVSAIQLVAKGYGETQPVSDNATAEGRAKNRRVVMQVLDNPGDVIVNQAK